MKLIIPYETANLSQLMPNPYVVICAAPRSHDEVAMVSLWVYYNLYETNVVVSPWLARRAEVSQACGPGLNDGLEVHKPIAPKSRSPIFILARQGLKLESCIELNLHNVVGK